MAYTDLVSSGVVLTADAATTYNFAFDTPACMDGSPHITHMGLQLDAVMAADPTLNSTLGGLITQLKIQVGSVTIIDFNPPVAAGDNDVISQIGVIAQSLGGMDWIYEYDTSDFKVLSELTFPVGLDATRSHRVNVTVGFNDVSNWSGSAGGFTAATTQLNVPVTFGTSTESTIIGSRQDFIISASAQRICTIFGKAGWSMLGTASCAASYAADTFSEYRLNNGAFRALKTDQWRALNGRFAHNPLTYITAGGATAPVYQNQQQGIVFLNLRRLTAGANMDMLIQNGTTDSATVSLFPIWVAPVGQGTGTAPRQTSRNVDNTTATVQNQDSYSNVGA